MSRADGRSDDELRELDLLPDWLEQAHGSVLYSQGKTRVLCTAMVEEGVPRWLYRSGRGWMTAEYSLLPASTGERVAREAAKGKQGGRTVEIQRLIGRALRSVCDFEALGERTLWLDCDVLQADGGTRCAAISGAYVAARARARPLRALEGADRLRSPPSRSASSTASRCSTSTTPRTRRAETDMNVVMTARRPARRGAGDRRARAVLARGARRAARPRRRRDRGDRRRAGRGRRCESVPDLSTAEALLRLLLAAGLGGAIGLERELRDHEAGFRTHLLVSLGACVFTLVSAYAWTRLDVLDAGGRRLRPDAHRGPDRHRHRLPRRRRDHRARDLGARADDGGDALGRGRDRHGRRRGLLRGRHRRGRARARLARPAAADLDARSSRRVRPEEAELGDPARARGRARRGCSRGSRSSAARSSHVEFGDERDGRRRRCGRCAAPSRRVWPRRSTSSTTSSACSGGREGAAGLGQRAQARGAARGAAGLGGRAARRTGRSRPRTGETY